MDQLAIKRKRQSEAANAANSYSAQLIGGVVLNAGFHRPGIAIQPAAAERNACGSTTDTVRLTVGESESFLRIVEKASKVSCHFELFRLLQDEVQNFIPHQILISAWGDFQGAKPKLDVISAIRGVRTGQLNGCGCSIELLLKTAFTRWVAGGRQPMLLDKFAAKLVTHSTCECALHMAMRGMRSVLVHGMRNERDNLDSLYMTLSQNSIMNGHSPERFRFLVDSVIAQVDVAYRKVAALKCSGNPAGAKRNANSLSVREQEIVKRITEGKTNAEIAAALGISLFTVKNHAQRIFRKLGATNRTEAVSKYLHESSSAT